MDERRAAEVERKAREDERRRIRDGRNQIIKTWLPPIVVAILAEVLRQIFQ